MGYPFPSLLARRNRFFLESFFFFLICACWWFLVRGFCSAISGVCEGAGVPWGSSRTEIPRQSVFFFPSFGVFQLVCAVNVHKFLPGRERTSAFVKGRNGTTTS